MARIDPAAADNVQYATDPRIRHLAETVWRIRTGGSRMDWLCLGKDNPEALIREAREWVRAAVAAGLMDPPQDDAGWKTAAHRAANAEEAQGDEPCAATFREEPMPDTVYCGERGYHRRHAAWQGNDYYAWLDGDEGAGWDR